MYVSKLLEKRTDEWGVLEFVFFSSRRRHTRLQGDWSSDVCSSDLLTDEQKRFQASKMAVHAAMVDRMDREIGRVLDQLRAMHALDNTVIFFLSDNGAEIGRASCRERV